MLFRAWDADQPGGQVYHEQQRQRCCGVHAVNNLLQLPPDSDGHLQKREADSIATDLRDADARASGVWSVLPCPASTYHSRVPCYGGNYDVDVLVEALRRRGCHITEHWIVSCKRSMQNFRSGLAQWLPRSPSTVGRLRGLLLNRRSRLGRGRHWLCLAPSGPGGAWLCHDSACRQPAALGGEAEGTTWADSIARHVEADLRRAMCLRQCLPGSPSPVHIFAVCSPS
mmetsp:Transcript_60631/g.189958  ORF Transcript_60631/g.189958 Transcript_60631/m.189958 type:complete len:227 (+) Transcript_60631:82-762(+)